MYRLLVLTAAFSTSCEVPAPSDLHPDAVAIYVLLFAGLQEAHMLATHPHRDSWDGAPMVTASLEGPGWTAGFSSANDLSDCRVYSGWGPKRCLRAWLPETIRPGVEYGLLGTTPLGPFTGEATVPEKPALLEPGDTSELPLPDSGKVRVPLRYRIDPATGTLMAHLVVNSPGRGSVRRTDPLDVAGADTIEWSVSQAGDPLTILLRLQGIGWNYANWSKHTGGALVPPPWPSFGIEGEEVYGYFDGVSRPSRPAYVQVK